MSGSPRRISSGDVDQDGFLDLVLVYNTPGGYEVLVGDGTGSLLPTGLVTTPDYPRDLVLEDFDLDGILDLALVGNNQASIRLGDGTGNFGPAINTTVGDTPLAAASADFDDDGILDLAVANYLSDDVSVLLGNGDGSFASGPLLPLVTNAFPWSVGAADFDDDGAVDIVTGNRGSDTVTLFRGTGVGSFGPAENYPAGIDPVRMAVDDLNSDGVPDVALVNDGSYNVSIMLGADVPFASHTLHSTPQWSQGIAIGDIDADGALDLVVTSEWEDNVTIFINQLGVISPPTFIRGDSNADSTLDIADATFILSYLFTAGEAPECFDAADVNRDCGVNIVDPLYLLAYLFTMGPDPSAPFPTCGTGAVCDPALVCDSFDACP